MTLHLSFALFLACGVTLHRTFSRILYAHNHQIILAKVPKNLSSANRPTRSSHFHTRTLNCKDFVSMARLPPRTTTFNDNMDTMMMMMTVPQPPSKEAYPMPYEDDDDETLSYYDEHCLFLPRSSAAGSCAADPFSHGIHVELLWDMMSPCSATSSAVASVVETDDGEDTWRMDEDEDETTLADDVDEAVTVCTTAMASRDTIFRHTSSSVLPPHPVSPCTEDSVLANHNVCWL